MMKIALVIGINDYPGMPLYCAVNDATAIADVLAYNGDHVKSKNFDVKLQLNITSKAALRKQLREFFDRKADISLLYFAGHGFFNSLGGYIVAPDYQDHDEGIHMTEILELANLSPASNKVIVLDCCHAGAIGKANNAGTVTPIREDMTVLTACQPLQEAMEVGGHGLFTHLLLQALNGGAADVMGEISPGGVYSYIDRALGAHGQRPVFKTNISSFVSLRKLEPQVPVSVIRKLEQYFTVPGAEFRLNPSFEETNTPGRDPLLREPYAEPGNVQVFKDLQQLQSIGLVVPVGEDYMYFAAMNSGSCRLTPLGHHYWRLSSTKKI